MSRGSRRLARHEISGMFARLMLGFVPTGFLTEAIVGDRHDHVVAWVLVYGVLFGTAFWAADRLRNASISAGRWWLTVLLVLVALTLLPEPVDLVLAALTLAVLSAMAAGTPRRPHADAARA